MAELKYIQGDLFSHLKDEKLTIIPHVCNDVGGWGAGFVLSLSKFSKKPERFYREYFSANRPGPRNLGNIQMVNITNNIKVANMISQHGYKKENNKKPLKYWALVDCMKKINRYLQSHSIDFSDVTIKAPKFGSALAGGRWEIVEALIIDIWLDYEINIEIYTI